MLEANHNGVARFGEGDQDKENLKRVLHGVKRLYQHAVSVPGMLAEIPSVIAEDEGNQDKAFEKRLKALKN